MIFPWTKGSRTTSGTTKVQVQGGIEDVANPTLVPHPDDIGSVRKSTRGPSQMGSTRYQQFDKAGINTSSNSPIIKQPSNFHETGVVYKQSIQERGRLSGYSRSKPPPSFTMHLSPQSVENRMAVKSSRVLKGLGTAGKIAGVGLMAGIGAYAAYSSTYGQVQAHEQVNKTFKRMKASMRNGGMNRSADFQYNPLMTFSRPRIRSGNMGASGGLTLALNNQRTG